MLSGGGGGGGGKWCLLVVLRACGSWMVARGPFTLLIDGFDCGSWFEGALGGGNGREERVLIGVIVKGLRVLADDLMAEERGEKERL